MIRKILRLPQVEEATGGSKSTIYKRISEGEFPKPVKLGTKSVGWPEDEVAPTTKRELLRGMPRGDSQRSRLSSLDAKSGRRRNAL